MNDVLSFLSWWFIVTVCGLVAWPLCFRLFRFLPDRGYSLSKTAGLLAVGYVGWLLGNFGFTLVNPGGMVATLLLVGALSLVALRGMADDLREWWSTTRWAVVAVEVLFVVAFATWAYARALNPNITATEKPMEFAFLNSVLRTGSQPPGDPWLAGYAISYYHFGYVIMGMLTALSGVKPSVAFNLGIALLFALTALGAFGVTFNLIAAAAAGRDHPSAGRESPGRPRRRLALQAAIFPALLGPLLVLLGNFNGFMEVAHHRGWFSPGFWQWLDIKWTNEPPQPAAEGWVPDRFLWWWQSSRVIHDRDLFGAEVEVIDEFPFFSFLLGDMHPHVLGLPFVFLGIAFGLNLFRRVEAGADRRAGEFDRAAGPGSLLGLLPLDWVDLLGGAVILGGLSFLNTWDFPIYMFVVVAAYAAARAQREGWTRRVWRDAALLGAALAVSGVLLYLPFYIGFRSQLGGILPNVIFGTRLQQFGVMFGPLLFCVLCVLGWMAVLRRREADWQTGFLAGTAILVSLVAMCVMLVLVAVLLRDRPEVAAAINGVLGGTPLENALVLVLARRIEIERLLTPLLLTGILILASALYFGLRRPADAEGQAPVHPGEPASSLEPFVVVLIATGALLTLGPEFVYLRDFFGSRMNTVFKFYYQTWVVWSMAGAFGAWMLLRMAKPAGQALFAAGLAAVVGMGLIYPTLATTTITENWKGTVRDLESRQYATLDGMAYMATGRSADYEAIRFLNATVKERPVIAEAVGGSYTEYARVSAHTGLPAVLGWPFHETQWRGSSEVYEGREGDGWSTGCMARSRSQSSIATWPESTIKMASLFMNTKGPDR
jgi:YYY domain-containing protein